MSQSQTRSRADDQVVSISALVKRYKKGAEALKGLSLNIRQGELFGLVGPDGAGKTTALKILSGIMQQTSGEVLINGNAPRDARGSIGYVPQNCALYPELSVEENLLYQAGLRGVSEDQIERLKDSQLRSMGLLDFKDRLASQLSGGMKQKLALCCALVGDPELILLDEPTTGLDPIARRELWQALAALSHEGVTAIIATPFLDEAERCNRIALMYDGKVELEGTPRELQEALGLRRLTFAIKNRERLNEVPSLIETLRLENIRDIYPFGDRLEILTSDTAATEVEVREKLEAMGISLSPARESSPTLENVFVTKLIDLGFEKRSKTEFPHWSTDSQRAAETALEARSLSKSFNDFRAVDDVSLEIKYGEIFGLLGANGAGKTTTIKMLCGLAKPTSGSVLLVGESSDIRSVAVRKNVGYMSQKFTLYDDLTVRENLEFYAGIYEIPLKLRKRQLDWAIDACNLKSIERSIVRKLPLGWKQRIAFGAAVMHDPKVIFLDEPTAGVDPLARRQLWTLIRDFAAHGAAILVTTHYLDEAEFCNRLAFMANSKIIAHGTPSQIKSDHDGELYELVTNNIQNAFQALTQSLEHWRVAIFGSSIHLLLDHESETQAVKSILQNAGCNAKVFRQIPFTLEDAFIDVVQRNQRVSPC